LGKLRGRSRVSVVGRAAQGIGKAFQQDKVAFSLNKMAGLAVDPYGAGLTGQVISFTIEGTVFGLATVS
jgi:hypothetical protein